MDLSLVFTERSYEFERLIETQRDIAKRRDWLVANLSALYKDRRKAKQDYESLANSYDRLRDEVQKLAFALKKMKEDVMNTTLLKESDLWLVPDYYNASNKKKNIMATLPKVQSDVLDLQTFYKSLDSKVYSFEQELKAQRVQLLQIQRDLDNIQLYYEVEDYTTYFSGEIDAYLELTRHSISIRKRKITSSNSYIYFKRIHDGRWYKSRRIGLDRESLKMIFQSNNTIDDVESELIDSIIEDHKKSFV